jgi:hypothetical protein
MGLEDDAGSKYMKALFVHFPKAGGASLLKSLNDSSIGKSLILHYGDDPVDPTSLTNQNERGAREVATTITSQSDYLIYGHFAPRTFTHTNYEDIFTILRHPIPWAFSLYAFWDKLRSEKFQGHEVFTIFCKENLGFFDMLELAPIKHIYTKTYFAGIERSDFSFVGTHENYSRDLGTISSKFSINLREYHEHTSNYAAEGRPTFGDFKIMDRLKIRTILRTEIDFYKKFTID